MKKKKALSKTRVFRVFLSAAVAVHFELSDVSAEFYAVMVQLAVFNSWTRGCLFCCCFYFRSLHSNFSGF